MENLQQELTDFIESLKDENKVYDVVLLDRCMISQFKDAPDIKPLDAVTYAEQVMNGFFLTLMNYERNQSQA